jgi:hypothetical protein
MPAYAQDGKVVCFFQSAQKFKTRYATFGFSDTANLDEGAYQVSARGLARWPPSIAHQLNRVAPRTLAAFTYLVEHGEPPHVKQARLPPAPAADDRWMVPPPGAPPPAASHDGDGVDLDEELGAQAGDDVDRKRRPWVGRVPRCWKAAKPSSSEWPSTTAMDQDTMFARLAPSLSRTVATLRNAWLACSPTVGPTSLPAASTPFCPPM